MQAIKLNTDSVFKLFLLFLPFTQALTLNIGFPLKISELILFFLIFIALSKVKLTERRLFLLRKNWILILFLSWVTISFFVNSIWQYNYPLKQVPYRVNPIIDSLLRLIYIYLAIITLFLSAWYFSKKPNLLNYWVLGAIVAASYSWYIFVSSGLNIPYLKLFGMEATPQAIGRFVRCGTFKEGNFFGMYLLLSAIIAFYLNRTKAGIFLMISIITTLSTATIVSAVIFVLYLTRNFFLKKKVLKYAIMSIPFIVVFLVFFIKTPFYKEYVYSKISEPSNQVSRRNFSKVDRVLSARIGYKQGINNPIFGVGPYNYGLHYDKYNDADKYIINIDEWLSEFFRRKNKRAIANNVYLEVWAEYGIVGFIIFIMFLINTVIVAFRNKNDIITGGVVAMLISFNAFPSFIMLFLWSFLAIPYSINYKNRLIN